MWSPEQYRKFVSERSRPFHELVARIEAPYARTVADLGCGDGALTAMLARKWPQARVWGVDSSAEMIASAARHAAPGRLDFEHAPLEGFRAPEPLDILVANASLHWVPDHARLVPALYAMLRPRGVLAFQVPGNFDEPSHVLLAELCRDARWAGALSHITARGELVRTPRAYLELLAGLGAAVDAWETTYYHVLEGSDPVLEWTSGTALRPIFAALDPSQHAAFRAEYGALLRAAYPSQSFGTVFPFRRIFVVATKAA